MTRNAGPQAALCVASTVLLLGATLVVALQAGNTLLLAGALCAAGGVATLSSWGRPPARRVARPRWQPRLRPTPAVKQRARRVTLKPPPSGSVHPAA